MGTKRGNPNALESIPGIGPSLAGDLRSLGVERISDLRNGDPEVLYDRLCRDRGVQMDRCVLYAFRCAVYYATERDHDPELLKWWRWKDPRA